MITVSEAITIALNYCQTGHISQAEAICHQILQQQPNSTEALHLLGVIAHQVGKLKQAIVYYQQAIALGLDRADVYYSLGAALDASGQTPEAIACYQQAIALKPDYAEVHYDLGHALQEQGHLSAAIDHYQQAVAFNPNDPEAHGNLGNALLEQGQVEAAIAHYQQVIALRPNDAGVYFNLGNAFKQQGQLEAAINHYRWAQALNPNYVDAYLQLGDLLYQQGDVEEALFYHQQATLLNPNFPDPYYKLGYLLLEQGRYKEAIVPYRQALDLAPDLVDAHNGLGCALMIQFEFESAAACFQQALTLNPDHAEAHCNLGLAFANQNKLDEAIDCFQKALQLKPDLSEAYWHSQIVLPILYDTPNQISFWRQRLCRGLNNLIPSVSLNTFESKKQALVRIKRSVSNFFYLSYQGLNDRGLQRKLGKFIHTVVAANYPQWARPLPMPPLTDTGKIRIGYLSGHFRTHSVAKTTIGWLKNCDQQRFEIYSYHIGLDTDSVTQQVQSYSDSFYQSYDNNIETVCQQIIADRLHILVFTDIGMIPETTPIAGLRLAPVQCVTWGHPITSGLPTIDYYLSSDLMEPENAQSHYSEKLVRLPNIGVCYEKPSIPELTKTRADFQLREDAIVYLSCQSLFKYLPQFDDIFAQIAQRVPQSQFAFLSSHSTTITAQFKTRLGRAFANFGLNSEDYCVFLPRQTQVDYFNLNLVANIFLDTFSWSGCNTAIEAIAFGLPVVTCPGKFMRSRHAYAILKMMGVCETIAQNETEYIEIAVRLGLEPDWRQDMVQKLYKHHSLLYDDRTCVTALESFYKNVVQQAAGNTL